MKERSAERREGRLFVVALVIGIAVIFLIRWPTWGVFGQAPTSFKGNDVYFHYQSLFYMQTEKLDPWAAQRKAFEFVYRSPWRGALLRLPYPLYVLSLFPMAVTEIEGETVAHSPALAVLVIALFAVTVFVSYWAFLPLGRLTSLVGSLLLGATHMGLTPGLLFQYVALPFLALSLGFWLRQKHVWAALAGLLAALILETYLVVPATYVLLSLLQRNRRGAIIHGAAAIIALAGIALHVAQMGRWDIYVVMSQGNRDPIGIARLVVLQLLTLDFSADPLSRALIVIPVVNLAVVAIFAIRSWPDRVERLFFWTLVLLMVLSLAQFGQVRDPALYIEQGKQRYLAIAFLAMPFLLAAAYQAFLRAVQRPLQGMK